MKKIAGNAVESFFFLSALLNLLWRPLKKEVLGAMKYDAGIPYHPYWCDRSTGMIVVSLVDVARLKKMPVPAGYFPVEVVRDDGRHYGVVHHWVVNYGASSAGSYLEKIETVAVSREHVSLIWHGWETLLCTLFPPCVLYTTNLILQDDLPIHVGIGGYELPKVRGELYWMGEDPRYTSVTVYDLIGDMDFVCRIENPKSRFWELMKLMPKLFHYVPNVVRGLIRQGYIEIRAVTRSGRPIEIKLLGAPAARAIRDVDRVVYGQTTQEIYGGLEPVLVLKMKDMRFTMW